MENINDHRDGYGRALRRYREMHDLTQKDVARATGITPQRISQIETESKTASYDNIHAIEKWTQIEVAEFKRTYGSETKTDAESRADANMQVLHIDLVKRFTDKKIAYEISRLLKRLEDIDTDMFREIRAYLEWQVARAEQKKQPASSEDEEAG